MIRSAVSPNMIKKEIEDKEIGVDLECDTKINIKSELDKGTTIEAMFDTNHVKSNEIKLGLHMELDIKCEQMEMFNDSNSCATDNSNIETVDTDIKEDPENNLSIMENNISIQSKLNAKKKIMLASDNTNQANAWEISETKYYTMQEHVKIETNKIEELESSVLNTETGNSSTNNTELTLYECNICNKQFKLKRNWSRHCSEPHNVIRERVYECEICKKKLSTNENLIFHLRTHSGERPYECKICKKNFIRKVQLNYHLRTHSGEKPYQCEICTKKFTTKHNLTAHLRTHSGEKPYQCEICKRTFLRKCQLDDHLLIHSGEKPYECEICMKKFTRRRSLERHLHTHTGEILFQCEICNKKFLVLEYLTEHLRTHCGERS